MKDPSPLRPIARDPSFRMTSLRMTKEGDMKLIVGLGNPGKEYDHTRHNIGWDAVTALAQKIGTSFQEKSRFQSEVAEGRLNEEKILLVRPLTYMNRSGEAVEAVLSFYKIDLVDVLVVHDEMDYGLGRLAFCAQAGPAGHNGIRSIQERLGTETVARLRLGIGRPVGQLAKEDYVLQRFRADEEVLVDEVLKQSLTAMEDWVEFGINKAMNKWNVKEQVECG